MMKEGEIRNSYLKISIHYEIVFYSILCKLPIFEGIPIGTNGELSSDWMGFLFGNNIWLSSSLIPIIGGAVVWIPLSHLLGVI